MNVIVKVYSKVRGENIKFKGISFKSFFLFIYNDLIKHIRIINIENFIHLIYCITIILRKKIVQTTKIQFD